jgi:heptosyltransferase-1
MDNFLIIRTSSLGDIVHTLPTFAALRKRFPQGKIRWIVDKNGKEILDLVPGLDEIIVVGSEGWRKRIKNRGQIALDFQGLLKSGYIAWLSRASRRLGFSRKNLKEPLAALFYTDRLGPVSEGEHVISKNLKLLSLLDIAADRWEFPIRVPDELRQSVKKKLESFRIPTEKKLAVFNVGAAWPTKRWFAENWAAVLRALDKSRVFPIFLWGTEEEKALADDIARITQTAVAPFFSIKEVFGLLQEASLLVSGDTFALQAACALGVPVVGIFGPTNPKRNGPFHPLDRVAYHEIACSVCYKHSCDSMECLRAVTPAEVQGLIESSLGAQT